MIDVPDNRRLGMLANALLADAAFVFAEPSAAFAPKAKPLFAARVTLSCGESLELLVVVEAELAKSLAANLLGIEEDSDEAQASSGEALGEWANILAGSLAAECKGGQSPPTIGIPVVSSETLAKAAVLLGKATRRANLVTETGQQLVVAVRPLETA